MKPWFFGDCLKLLSAAVINTRTKSNVGRKGLISASSPSQSKVRTKLKGRREAEAMEKNYLLACSAIPQPPLTCPGVASPIVNRALLLHLSLIGEMLYKLANRPLTDSSLCPRQK